MKLFKLSLPLLCVVVFTSAFSDTNNYAEVDLRTDACTVLVDEQSGNPLVAVKDVYGNLVYKMINYNAYNSLMPRYKCINPQIINAPYFGDMLLPITLMYGISPNCTSSSYSASLILASSAFRSDMSFVVQSSGLSSPIVTTGSMYEPPNIPWYQVSELQYLGTHTRKAYIEFSCRTDKGVYTFGGDTIDI